MRIFFKFVLFAAFVACMSWALLKPGFDSITAAVISLGTLLGGLIAQGRTEPSQSQTVGDNSIAIQAGRDANTNK